MGAWIIQSFRELVAERYVVDRLKARYLDTHFFDRRRRRRESNPCAFTFVRREIESAFATNALYVIVTFVYWAVATIPWIIE